nr:helix-turn-helix transcriptional regulator [Desulfovibrio aminophilus]
MRITRRQRRDTGSAEFCVVVPVERADEVEMALHRLLPQDEAAGLVVNDRGEAVVPAPESTPGQVLKGFRLRDGLTQRELAKQLGIAQHHVSEMERGKRAISKKMAERLAVFFQEPMYRVFL